MPKVTLNKEQLNLIEKAIQFYIRIGLGQLERIKEHPLFNHKNPQIDPIINQLKEILLQEDNVQQIGWSINNKKVTPQIRHLFDIHQQIKDYQWKEELKETQIKPNTIIHLQDEKNVIKIE